MKNVIVEYASSIVAVFGTVSLFVTIDLLLMGRDGMIATLIIIVLGGL